MKENVGSFVVAAKASKEADFPYSVSVVIADDSAVGKQHMYVNVTNTICYNTLKSYLATDHTCGDL